MIIGLLTIIYSMLFGGSVDPFVLPDAQKVVKQAIEDKERKKEVTKELKLYSKEWKSLQKLNKKQSKSIARLNSDFSIDTQFISKEFESHRSARKEIEDQIIEYRYAIQAMITDNEWEVIMQAVANPKAKTIKKKDKAQLKSQLKREKKIIALENEIKDAFGNSPKVEEVIEDLDQFEEDMAEFLFVMQEEAARVAEVMENRDASKEDLTEIVVLNEDFRAKVHTSFLKLRGELIELSTPEQWPKIAKALNKLF